MTPPPTSRRRRAATPDADELADLTRPVGRLTKAPAVDPVLGPPPSTPPTPAPAKKATAKRAGAKKAAAKKAAAGSAASSSSTTPPANKTARAAAKKTDRKTTSTTPASSTSTSSSRSGGRGRGTAAGPDFAGIDHSRYTSQTGRDRVQRSIYWSTDTYDNIRAATAFLTAYHPQAGIRSISDIVSPAIDAYLEWLATQYNDGNPFPGLPAGGGLQPGRPRRN